MKSKRMSLFEKQENKPVLEEVNEPPKNMVHVKDEEGKIRVSAGKKKRFSVFDTERDDSNISYKTECIKGRNPVREVNSAMKGQPQKLYPLRGRNPVEIKSHFEQHTTPNSTSRASDTNLAGRNPVERKARSASVHAGACDPYGNKIPTRRSSLEGRNPQEFNGSKAMENRSNNDAFDPYGNPIRASSSPLAGRNPQDFDKPCDPYGPTTPIRRSSLEGRNPVDFDVPRDPYGNPLNKSAKATTVITVDDDDGACFGEQAIWQDDPFTRTSSTPQNTSKAQDGSERRSSISKPKPDHNRRSSVKVIPAAQREKFSLKTYHVPRGSGVPVK